MNSILKKVLTYLILPACIAGLTYALVSSIMEPVHFEKHREYRKDIAVQRLKDIRELQVAYKNVNGKYTADIDSLITFYKEGKMKVVMQIGSQDDSVAVANTKALKARKPRIKPEEMLKLCFYMKDTCFCSIGDAVKTILPTGTLGRVDKEYFALAGVDTSQLGIECTRIYEYIVEKSYICKDGHGVYLEELQKKFGEDLNLELSKLIAYEWLQIPEAELTLVALSPAIFFVSILWFLDYWLYNQYNCITG